VESSDLVRERFCAKSRPAVTSLLSLQQELKTEQLQQLAPGLPLHLEFAAMSFDQKTRRFYLLSFTQACNESHDGCTPSDPYTSHVERGWVRVEIEDDDDLKNTALDCRQCHQRARQGDAVDA
jgi:hypothetical protein